jgi:hypothetical protein
MHLTNLQFGQLGHYLKNKTQMIEAYKGFLAKVGSHPKSLSITKFLSPGPNIIKKFAHNFKNFRNKLECFVPGKLIQRILTNTLA